MTILDSRGRYLADMDEPAPRPSGPWDANRGADVRLALAGERPICERPIVTVCGWCPDRAELTAAARAHGFDVSHGICDACDARINAELDAAELLKARS